MYGDILPCDSYVLSSYETHSNTLTVLGPRREANHSPLSGGEFKNAWTRTTTTPIRFMASQQC